MLLHIKEFFPEEYEELGENGVIDIVREGIVNSAKYDIRSEQDVCRYIDLMVVFGDDLDIDPELTWMAEILNQRSLQSEEKLDRIYENISKLPVEEDKS